jgi:NAD+ diphosphatase
MHLSEKTKLFNYCPSCRSGNVTFECTKKFSCGSCSFTYYHNVAAAVAAILEYDKKIVLIRRAKKPGKGKLDLPGGFVNPNESAEEALRREIKEELKIKVGKLKYLGSYPNIYKYEGVTYYTCDLFFYSKIDKLPTDFDREEVKELIPINPSDISENKIAFKSVKMALRMFKSSKHHVKH